MLAATLPLKHVSPTVATQSVKFLTPIYGGTNILYRDAVVPGFMVAVLFVHILDD